MTPIDFGKSFLEDFYRQRDEEKSASYFGDDVVWVTPTAIRHFLSKQEIREFISASIRERQEPYKVDVVSIRKAAAGGPVSNITYEINLIPREVEKSLYLRCSLAIHKTGISSQEIVSIHISGEQQQTKVIIEQNVQSLREQLALKDKALEEEAAEVVRLKDESERALKEQADGAEQLLNKMRAAYEEETAYAKDLEQQLGQLAQAKAESEHTLTVQIAGLTEEAAAREEALREEARQQLESARAASDERMAQQQGDFAQREKELTARIRELEVSLQETRLAVDARDKENRRKEAIREEERRNEQAAIDQIRMESEVDRKARAKTMQRMMTGVRGVVGNSLDLQAMLDDVAAIGEAAAGQSALRSGEFSFDSCLATVRRLTKAKCRTRGLIFNYRKAPHMPEALVGDKAKLQMVLLNVLENAAENTYEGGTVTLSCSADAPVRDRVYLHFVVEDTGDGISEDELLSIFDSPTSDLSISKELVRLMGGGIQVRTHQGGGTAFEITVAMRCASN